MSVRILERVQLSEMVFKLVFEAPLIARKRKAGQFVILRIHEQGERVPLTIADADSEAGTVTVIFQAVGKSTRQLSMLSVGDEILDLVGPLGQPTHIEKFGTVCCIGGGIGVAPMHPIMQAMKAAGNEVIAILGARNKDLIIMEDEFRRRADEVLITTDDGSAGFHGFLNLALEETYLKPGRKIDLVVAIGPVPMMRAITDMTAKYSVPTVVSLNAVMVDGTGMCGGCRVIVGGEVKYACVDGPEFDGHKVDFKSLGERQRTYIEQEKQSDEHYCRCLKGGN